MKLTPTSSLGRDGIAALLLASFAILLVALPAAPAARAASSVLSTVSSASCENNDATFSSSFFCSLHVTTGSAIVVFFGCLGGTSANCNKLSVVDSLGDTYSVTSTVETSCGGDTCNEYGFGATALSTGADTLTFTSAGSAYLGGDVYDVAGINASAFRVGFGGSSANGPPSTIFGSVTAYPYGFVAAGVIANDASQFLAGTGYTLISGQPCYQCGMVGGWQASEYQLWGNSTSPTQFPFAYSKTNLGWAELGVSFAPNTATASVTCTPSPVTVTMASQCTSTVKGASPTGTVTWTSSGTGKFSASSCALSSGSCSVAYTPSLPSSPVTITGNYGGDLNNRGASGNFSLSVAKDLTTTTVACSPSPISAGSPTTCAASVSGVSPTGTITWASSKVANFSPATTCTLSAGSCAVDYTPSSTTSPVTITAIYSGDVDNNASTGTFPLAVNSASVSSSTSSSPSSSSSSSISSSLASSSASSTKSSSTAVSTTAPLTTTTTPVSSTTVPSSTASSSTGASGSAVSPAYLGVVAIEASILLILAFALRPRRVGEEIHIQPITGT